MKSNSFKIIFTITVIIIAIIIIRVIIKQESNRKNTNQEIESTHVNSEKNNEIIEEFVDLSANGIKLNTSNRLKETKVFKNLLIKDIQLSNDGEKTELIANIENTSNNDTQAMLIDILMYDKNQNVIATLGGRISPIKSHQTIQFSTSSMIDYANVYDFEFKEK